MRVWRGLGGHTPGERKEGSGGGGGGEEAERGGEGLARSRPPAERSVRDAPPPPAPYFWHRPGYHNMDQADIPCGLWPGRAGIGLSRRGFHVVRRGPCCRLMRQSDPPPAGRPHRSPGLPQYTTARLPHRRLPRYVPHNSSGLGGPFLGGGVSKTPALSLPV